MHATTNDLHLSLEHVHWNADDYSLGRVTTQEHLDDTSGTLATSKATDETEAAVAGAETQPVDRE